MARYLLTDKTIQKGAKDGLRRLSDGDGLYILFSVKGGSHGWRMDYSLDGRRKTLSLGTYPDTSLALARQKADEFRQLIAQGLDPSDVRKNERQKTLKTLEADRRQEQGLPAEGCFEHVAREWHQTVHIAKVSPGHAERTLTRLTQDVFPWLGSMPIASISAPKLLETLRRVEKRGAIETAHRIRQACGQIFRYGIAIGACERDPAHDLRDALSPVVVQHHAAITDPQKLGGLLRSFHDYTGLPVTCAALKLAPLVFLRPGELRQAEWAEFDLDAGLWTIPASRMKRLKDRNSMLARVCSRFAGWVAEIGPRAFAHGLTQQTQFYVTRYTRARAHLTASYDILCPMRQTRRGMGKGIQKLDTLGDQSDHPVHPFAGIVVRQHHVESELPAQHSGNGSTHGVGLPARGQHQLQAGRPLRAEQCHHQRGELGTRAHRDALQKLEVVGGVHRLDVIRRHGSLLADGRVARVGHDVAVVGRLDPPALQQ